MTAKRAPIPTIFMGTPDFAVPTLQALLDDDRVDVRLAVTQPDRARGRGQRTKPCPVAAAADAAGVPTFKPRRVRDEESVARLRDVGAELVVVVAFGQILPPTIIELPKYGCINVHASLLPRWRGAAPIHWAVLSGDAVTGVTVMEMDENLDTGPIYGTATTMIRDAETTGDLHDRLASLGGATLTALLERIVDPAIEPTPQPGERSTYARKLTPDDRAIDFRRSAANVAYQINGLNPWPGATAQCGEESIRLCRARRADVGTNADPLEEQTHPVGTIRQSDDGRIFVRCGDGGDVELLELQRPGKRPIRAVDCLRGLKLPPESRFAADA